MSKPEWLTILEAQIAACPRHTVYALATIDGGAPRVRHVVHRGISPSGLLLATTDKRMPKAQQISHDPHTEIAWFFAPSMMQIRIRARAFTFPAAGSRRGFDDSEEEDELTEEGTGIAFIPTMKALGRDAPESKYRFWEKERERLFVEAMSPQMRASFAKPSISGTLLEDIEVPRDQWPKELSLDPKTDEEARALDFAHDNFAVLALYPERVETLELAENPHRRIKWKRVGNGWEKEELVP